MIRRVYIDKVTLFCAENYTLLLITLLYSVTDVELYGWFGLGWVGGGEINKELCYHRRLSLDDKNDPA